MISSGNSISFTREGTEVINQSGLSTAPEIYRTARIFRRPSYYKFQLDSVGLHFLRLHFSAASSPTEPLTARFTVSATFGSNRPLKSFSLQNCNKTPQVDEFLLMINSLKLKISLVPNRSSLALVNAIEVFTAPKDLTEFAKNLRTIYRLNVKSNYRHFIRAHFFDIKNNESQPSDFYLYVNGHWRLHVNPSDHHGLVTPFYIDVVNVSDGSGLLNVSLGNTEPYKDAGFLNGLEVMEFLESSSNGSSYRVYIFAGCAGVALFLVLGFLFTLFLKRRRSKKMQPEVEVTVWSPLPLYRGGGSSENGPFYSGNNSPLVNLSLGLKIPFKDILIATNNFHEKLLIGKGSFGDVYKAILPDESKVAIKRGKTSSGQGILEFQTEIQVLSRIWHRHLVSLTGYGEENSEMVLVYEFIENGTLQEHLTARICLCCRGNKDWRFASEQPGDCIISTLVVRNQESISISTNIKGMYGYLDPEYMHLPLEEQNLADWAMSCKSNGVVDKIVDQRLAEIRCVPVRSCSPRGFVREPALNRHLPLEEQNLADWAMSCKSNGVVDKIVDQRLAGQIEPNILRKFMEVAGKCLKDSEYERPSMVEVSWELEYILRLQMMTILEDSAASISSCVGDGSLVVPRLMLSDSFSCNSIVQEDQVNKYGSTNSSRSQTPVLSQVREEPLRN
ncbi:hypothetical protein F2Q70_00027719 [Brassica cretica]|uniref:Protein kinase domain-containing protein n=1 Tax=Brassica cretica TaxID=69181 RepID=A0A8S9LBI7_BRACR|nr:hypothetical protein F2Q70_00027719 [Brassica cretica]